MIRVNVMQTVELTDDAAREVFDTYLKTVLIRDDDLFIDAKTGKVMESHDYGHGTPSEEEMKNPSEVLIAAIRLRDALRDMRRAARDARENRRKRERDDE